LKDLIFVAVEQIGSNEIGILSVADEQVNYDLMLKGDECFD